MPERIVCTKCNKEKSEKDFFKMKTGERYPMCKPCLTMHIDNRDPQTFVWILEKFNVPYIERKWIETTNKIYQKNPAKFGPSSVIGQYLRMMNMVQYRDFTYADTDRLNYKNEKEENAQQELEYEQQLKEKFDNGEISEAEYATLSHQTPVPDDPGAAFIPDYAAENEAEIERQLEEEDRLYLMNKWGPLYKASEWVRMETMYSRYANEYDLNVDREETLKQMCKVSLKLDQAIDMNVVSDIKSLTATLDSLRKSGKFTEAQNKDEKVRYLDTIGELVALCEREGGIIEQMPDPDEYPQDKIDFTIKDMKNYTYNLVSNEYGLGDLIESYIEKLEKSEEMDDLDLEGKDFVLSAEDAEKQALSQTEAEEFAAYQHELALEDETLNEAEALLAQFGGN